MSYDASRVNDDLALEMRAVRINDDHIAVSDHPSWQRVHVGQHVLLRCSVQTNCMVQWQWLFDSRALPGETQQMLLLDPCTVNMQGFYQCIITCCCSRACSVTTRKAFIGVAPPSESPELEEFVATDKIALLIGNDLYQHHSKLDCASRDVTLLGKILKEEMNFKTLTFSNLNRAEMEFALNWFYSLLCDGCYCLLYFSGHGYAVRNNLYLLPTDAPAIPNITDPDRHCINIKTVAETIQRMWTPKLTVVLPDTCRLNNLNQNVIQQSVPMVHGNVVFAYATINNRRAYEMPQSRHSIFADALRRHLRDPRRVSTMLTSVGDLVHRGGHQTVEVTHSLPENRCLTDRVWPLGGEQRYESNCLRWSHVHETPRVLRMKYVCCGVAVLLRCTSLLTNSVLLELIPDDTQPRPPSILDYSVFFDWTKMINYQRVLMLDCDSEPLDSSKYYGVIQVSNLQKLTEVLKVDITLVYVTQDQQKGVMLNHKYYQRDIRLPFIDEWRANFQ